MYLASFPELKKLARREKLKLADELWQAGIGESTPVAVEQASALDARWASYQAGTTRRIGLAELKRRLKRK